MLALKLKLDPSPEQMKLLNEAFWKWASICTRMAKYGNSKDAKERLDPKPSSKGIWFSKTQIWQANTDIADAKEALERAATQKERALERSRRRAADIKDALENESARDKNPKRKCSFRIKAWVDAGYLKTKYHAEGHYRRELEKLGKEIERKGKTIETLKAGEIHMKPTRITLHKNSFRVNFKGKTAIISPFEKNDAARKNLEIALVTEPIQPISGSSMRSAEYLKNGIIGFISYAINQRFFGFSDSEKMSLKAKAPEKVAKKEAKLAKKKEKLGEKLKELGKFLGRTLTDAEVSAIRKETERFFADISGYSPDKEYAALIGKFANEIISTDRIFNPNKYPILIRKQINGSKMKKFENLGPDEWEYYLQLSYEPFAKQSIKTQRFMGIDRGLKHLLAVSIFDPATNSFVYNKLFPNPVLEWKWNLRRLKKSIRNDKMKAMNNGEHVHENQERNRLRSLEGRIDDLYHNVSREIVDVAVSNQAEIVLESLEGKGMKQHGRSKGRGMKSLNYALSNFDYGKIAQLIRYKAELQGVPMYDVVAAGTSQNCAKCIVEGKDPKRYVRNGKEGHCPEHYPKGIDADLNAARTIALSRFKGINDPKPFGERVKYRFKAK